MRYKDDFINVANAYREQGKPVVFCGDVNTAHTPIDLARPKQNKKTTGFLPEERAWIDKIIDEQGWVDIYRELNPEEEGAYSWWSYRGGARERNVGWRIDYFFISPDLRERVQDASIHADVMGSDHCPISLTLA
jgi:exodeoxyribonuclease-3